MNATVTITYTRLVFTLTPALTIAAICGWSGLK